MNSITTGASDFMKRECSRNLLRTFLSHSSSSEGCPCEMIVVWCGAVWCVKWVGWGVGCGVWGVGCGVLGVVCGVWCGVVCVCVGVGVDVFGGGADVTSTCAHVHSALALLLDSPAGKLRLKPPGTGSKRPKRRTQPTQVKRTGQPPDQPWHLSLFTRNIRHVEYEVFLLQGERPRPKGLPQVLGLAR